MADEAPHLSGFSLEGLRALALILLVVARAIPPPPLPERTEEPKHFDRDTHVYNDNDRNDGDKDDNSDDDDSYDNELSSGYAVDGRRPVVAGRTFFVITNSKETYVHSCHCRLARGYTQRRQRAHTRTDRTRLVDFHFSARNATRTDQQLFALRCAAAAARFA